MLRFLFKRGLKIRCGLKEWSLQKKMPNGHLYFETQEGEPLSVSQAEFYRKYLAKEWIVVDDGLLDGKFFYEASPRDLQTFSKKQQQKAMRKFEYLTAIIQPSGRFISSPAQLKPMIKGVAARIHDLNPPSTISVYRWYRRYQNGKSVINLVDQDEQKGRRTKLGGDILEILHSAVEEVYLNPQKNTVEAVYEKGRGETRRLNMSRPNITPLKPPSRSTVYRYIKSLETYSVDVARLGKAEADRRFSIVTGEQATDRLLERWEIDHTPLDLILVMYLADGLHTIGRPWITVILDKYSRMVMGFYMSLHTPSAQSVMKCLKHSIELKDEFIAQFDDIKSIWPAHGLPETLVCDNGMDLHASAVVQVCHELGIQLQFCPAKSPKYKGSIERFFRRLNEELIHTLPGTVFSNPKQRGDYPSERMACIDMETLTNIVTKWIVDIYHQTPHKTLKTTPQAKWQEGLKYRTGIELPADPQQLSIIMGIPAERTLFHYGLEVNKLYYNSQSLQSIRRQHGQNIRVKLKYYEDNLGYIHVFDPIHKESFQVPAIKQNYASGLTLDQHEAISRLLNETGDEKAGDIFERREELKVLICKAQKSKKMAQRKRSAVLEGVDSEQPTGRLRKKTRMSATNVPAIKTVPAITPNLSRELPTLKITSRLDFPNQNTLWESDHA
ncbi:MAG: DDE-type integrase/transposase/recombinase [Pseudomonadota bacterium]